MEFHPFTGLRIEMDGVKGPRNFSSRRGQPTTFSKINYLKIRGRYRASNWIGYIRATLRARTNGTIVLEEKIEILSSLIPINSDKTLSIDKPINFSLSNPLNGVVEIDLYIWTTIGYIDLYIDDVNIVYE